MASKSEIWRSNLMEKLFLFWEFQFRMFFFIGKDLWGHIDGTTVKNADTTKSAQLVMNNAKIISWILSSIDQQIVLNLRPHKTAKKMLEYIRKIYNEDNSADSWKLLSIAKELSLFKIITPDF